MRNALSLEIDDMMSKVFFALISAETLDCEASLIFDERLPSFEDFEDSFGGFIGNGVYPAIASKVVGECDEIASIADGGRYNWSVNIGVNEFERSSRAILVGEERLASLLAKEIEVAFFWCVVNANTV